MCALVRSTDPEDRPVVLRWLPESIAADVLPEGPLEATRAWSHSPRPNGCIVLVADVLASGLDLVLTGATWAGDTPNMAL